MLPEKQALCKLVAALASSMPGTNNNIQKMDWLRLSPAHTGRHDKEEVILCVLGGRLVPSRIQL